MIKVFRVGSSTIDYHCDYVREHSEHGNEFFQYLGIVTVDISGLLDNIYMDDNVVKMIIAEFSTIENYQSDGDLRDQIISILEGNECIENDQPEEVVNFVIGLYHSFADLMSNVIGYNDIITYREEIGEVLMSFDIWKC